jgi:hypothetical protein
VKKTIQRGARNLLRRFVDVRRYDDASVSVRFHGDPGLSVSLEEYVEWLRRGEALGAAVCFDADRTVQREIIGIFSSAKVAFFSHPHLGNGAPSPAEPKEGFLLEVGLESFDLAELASHLGWFESRSGFDAWKSGDVLDGTRQLEPGDPRDGAAWVSVGGNFGLSSAVEVGFSDFAADAGDVGF